MNIIVRSLFSDIYPHSFEDETWCMLLKKKKKKSSRKQSDWFCASVRFSILSHHAGKDGRSSRVVWVGEVRWGVEGSRGARSVDAVAVGSQWKGVDWLIRPGGLQGLCESIELQSGAPLALPALTRHFAVARLNSVLLHGEGSVHLRRWQVTSA